MTTKRLSRQGIPLWEYLHAANQKKKKKKKINTRVFSWRPIITWYGRKGVIQLPIMYDVIFERPLPVPKPLCGWLCRWWVVFFLLAGFSWIRRVKLVGLSWSIWVRWGRSPTNAQRCRQWCCKKKWINFFCLALLVEYSGDLNNEHLNNGNIWIK